MKTSRSLSILLAMLVQVSPVVRLFQATSVLARAPLGIMLKWVVGGGATLGSYHAVTGASTTHITSPDTASATNGVPFSYVIRHDSGKNDKPPTYSAVPLPSGLSLSTTNEVVVILGKTRTFVWGLISGVPESPGTTVIHLAATHEDKSATKDLTVTVEAVAALPKITRQPAAQTVFSDGEAVFSVDVDSGEALTFAWRHNGELIPGEDAASITLSNCTAEQAGDYSVDVSNSIGLVASEAAVLNVVDMPTFNKIQVNGQDIALEFTVAPLLIYTIEYAETPQATSWTVLEELLPSDTTMQATVTDSMTSRRMRFYRVRASNPVQ